MAMLLLLDEEPGVTVVGITDRLQSLFSQVEATQSDILLLGWELPSQMLTNLHRDIQVLGRPLKIVFFSNNPEYEDEILTAGADDFICTNAPPDSLLPILHKYEMLSAFPIEKEDETGKKDQMIKTSELF
jgi:DNA-binding NarL/FixJ family response regulator